MSKNKDYILTGLADLEDYATEHFTGSQTAERYRIEIISSINALQKKRYAEIKRNRERAGGQDEHSSRTA